MESMMSARQVAELLGVHENWVYDQAVGGDLPSYKLGGTRRFRRDEIDGWIEEHRERGRHAQPKRQAPRPNPERRVRRGDSQPTLFE
jgi:excisionase family DNA binding protein